MTPKEKAEELVLKFKELPQEGTMMFYLAFEMSKKCALIAAKEISDTIENMSWIKNEEYFIKANFWEDVQKEIKRL